MCESRANYFFGNIPDNPQSVKVLAIDALQQRGYGFEIREAGKNLKGDAPHNHIGVYYEESINWYILEKLCETPEFVALEGALNIAALYPIPENEYYNRDQLMIDYCVWDEVTRKRLEGFFWQTNQGIWLAAAQRYQHKKSVELSVPLTGKKLLIGVNSSSPSSYKDNLKASGYCAKKAAEVLRGNQAITIDEYPDLISQALDERIPVIEAIYPYQTFI